MNKKSGLIIFLVFALPIMLFYIIKPNKENTYSAANAEAVKRPKVLQFSQVMCSECRKLEKTLPSIKEEYKNKVLFVKIDVADRTEETSELIEKYEVRVVPTLVFIDKKGKTTKVTEGAIPKEELKKYLDDISNE